MCFPNCINNMLSMSCSIATTAAPRVSSALLFMGCSIITYGRFSTVSLFPFVVIAMNFFLFPPEVPPYDFSHTGNILFPVDNYASCDSLGIAFEFLWKAPPKIHY
ncbi:hypothetical protein DPX39_020031900 [Trypanosoma brucei equiperdum]|uniref:Uncharacterized protein n=1 Tax=Trypanosoma brucei equiperdum TaxID=630700 RepID=A0A3L6LCJ2_9TRYP|nr:hypothetical protein DPX39_020031900 [Trypanosoma brucei equiperdum]